MPMRRETTDSYKTKQAKQLLFSCASSKLCKKALYLIALAHPNASLDGVCGTIWAQRERSCKVQTSCRVLSVEGDAFDVVKFGEKLSVLILKTA